MRANIFTRFNFILGVLLAVTRQGWLSLFMAAVVVPEVNLVPLLTLIMLPAWLLVTGKPEMLMKPAGQAESEATPAATTA